MSQYANWSIPAGSPRTKKLQLRLLSAPTRGHRDSVTLSPKMPVRFLVSVWVLRQLLRQWVTRRAQRIPYTQRSHQRILPGIIDYPTLAASRLARAFQSIVEIGAAGGGRIVTIKREVPDISAIAMDIADDYKSVRHQDGVTFQTYDPSKFAIGGLVFCVGTLNCMRPDELEKFFSALAERQCWLLMFEPEPPFAHSKTYRRNIDCWYHPYRSIAQRHGLVETNDAAEWPHTASLKNFENWKPILFKPK